MAYFTDDAVAWLSEQQWKGNVRELRNFIERVFVLHPDEEIDRSLADRLMTPNRQSMDSWLVDPLKSEVIRPANRAQFEFNREPVDLRALVNNFEQHHIERALSRAGGAIAESARLLGLRRTTLIEKMKRLQIQNPNVNRQLSSAQHTLALTSYCN